MHPVERECYWYTIVFIGIAIYIIRLAKTQMKTVRVIISIKTFIVWDKSTDRETFCSIDIIIYTTQADYEMTILLYYLKKHFKQ